VAAAAAMAKAAVVERILAKRYNDIKRERKVYFKREARFQ
jgi:hypothetical protein